MAVYAAVAVGGVVPVGVVVSSALFLSRLPPSFTPYLFILPGLATIPILLACNALGRRVRLERLVVLSSLALGALALGFRLLLARRHERPVPARPRPATRARQASVRGRVRP